jgi:uncharacterized protein with FMN-binding domain
MQNTPTKLTSRKIPVALTLIIISILYAVWHNFAGTEQTVEVSTPAITYKNNPAQTVQTPQPQKSFGIYTDGTYTGTPVNAYYGTVQVQATVQNGALADVTFLQYPSDRSTSKMISNKAMPILTKEALQIQSAQVDGVSGATDTSNAFKQSLASALTQAKI